MLVHPALLQKRLRLGSAPLRRRSPFVLALFRASAQCPANRSSNAQSSGVAASHLPSLSSLQQDHPPSCSKICAKTARHMRRILLVALAVAVPVAIAIAAYQQTDDLPALGADAWAAIGAGGALIVVVIGLLLWVQLRRRS
jgi:hypothetical protein